MITCRPVLAMWFLVMLLSGFAEESKAQQSLSPATQSLFEAVWNNDIVAARTSVAQGADLGAEDDFGLRAVDLAVDKGHFDIAHYLLSADKRRRELAREKTQTPAQLAPLTPYTGPDISSIGGGALIEPAMTPPITPAPSSAVNSAPSLVPVKPTPAKRAPLVPATPSTVLFSPASPEITAGGPALTRSAPETSSITEASVPDLRRPPVSPPRITTSIESAAPRSPEPVPAPPPSTSSPSVVTVASNVGKVQVIEPEAPSFLERLSGIFSNDESAGTPQIGAGRPANEPQEEVAASPTPATTSVSEAPTGSGESGGFGDTLKNTFQAGNGEKPVTARAETEPAAVVAEVSEVPAAAETLEASAVSPATPESAPTMATELSAEDGPGFWDRLKQSFKAGEENHSEVAAINPDSHSSDEQPDVMADGIGEPEQAAVSEPVGAPDAVEVSSQDGPGFWDKLTQSSKTDQSGPSSAEPAAPANVVSVSNVAAEPAAEPVIDVVQEPAVPTAPVKETPDITAESVKDPAVEVVAEPVPVAAVAKTPAEDNPGFWDQLKQSFKAGHVEESEASPAEPAPVTDAPPDTTTELTAEPVPEPEASSAEPTPINNVLPDTATESVEEPVSEPVVGPDPVVETAEAPTEEGPGFWKKLTRSFKAGVDEQSTPPVKEPESARNTNETPEFTAEVAAQPSVTIGPEVQDEPVSQTTVNVAELVSPAPRLYPAAKPWQSAENSEPAEKAPVLTEVVGKVEASSSERVQEPGNRTGTETQSVSPQNEEPVKPEAKRLETAEAPVKVPATSTPSPVSAAVPADKPAETGGFWGRLKGMLTSKPKPEKEAAPTKTPKTSPPVTLPAPEVAASSPPPQIAPTSPQAPQTASLPPQSAKPVPVKPVPAIAPSSSAVPATKTAPPIAAPQIVLGANLKLGRSLKRQADDAGQPQVTCVEKTAWQVTYCIENVVWPETVKSVFDVRTSIYRGVKSIVEYRAGISHQVHILFPAGAFKIVAEHLKAKFGAPTEVPDKWTALLGAPKRFNTTWIWRTGAEGANQETLEIREIDDFRWSAPPDTAHGVIRLYRRGAPPVFKLLSSTDLLLANIRRGGI